MATWFACGSVAIALSRSLLAPLTLQSIDTTIESVSDATGVGIIIPMVIASYFLGHILFWIARKGKPVVGQPKRPWGWWGLREKLNGFLGRPPEWVSRGWHGVRVFWQRLFRSLKPLSLRIPKPSQSYHENLAHLMNRVRSSLMDESLTRDTGWYEFYPVAKSYILNNSKHSLIGTYQNKYTLHRSLSAASALWLWGNAICLLYIRFVLDTEDSIPDGYVEPYIGLMLLWLFSSFLLMKIFESSFRYNWQLWGNTIVTESYALMFCPALKHDDKD